MPSASDFRRAFGLEPGAVLHPAAGGKRRRGGAATAQHLMTLFELVSVRVGHEALTPNERYAFPTEVVLALAAKTPRRGRSSATSDDASTADGARDAATAALREALRDRHMVYSAYGSPYECAYELDTLRLHDKDEDAMPPGSWRATVRGVAHRRRDMPTKAQQVQQREASHDASDDDAVKKQAAKKEERARVRAEAKAHGLRVVASRFGSGVCSICGAAIEHGQMIARPDAADAAGKHGGWSHAACALQPRTPRRARAS
jgi:hypothetical protein